MTRLLRPIFKLNGLWHEKGHVLRKVLFALVLTTELFPDKFYTTGVKFIIPLQ